MTKYKRHAIVDGRLGWVVVDENERVINKYPSKDELKGLQIEKYKIKRCKINIKCEYTDDELLNFLKAKDKKCEKGTLGWLRDQANKDGFDNIRNWQIWKREQKWLKNLENKYGKEFADWAKENKDKIGSCIIDTGCKTDVEYKNKCAIDAGFKDSAERLKKWRHKTGRQLPKEDNPDCASWFGYIGENYVGKTFEDPVRMPYGNPGFDWICKKGEKIDHKCACLSYNNMSNWSGWIFHIYHNNIADWFILSAWDNRDSLNPLHVWAFHKNDMVKYGKGGCAPKLEFWKRDTITITNTPEGIKEFAEYEVTDRLEKLKELCRQLKYKGDNIKREFKSVRAKIDMTNQCHRCKKFYNDTDVVILEEGPVCLNCLDTNNPEDINKMLKTGQQQEDIMTIRHAQYG